MPLLKDGRLVDDPWRTVAADEALPMEAPAILSLDRWQAEREALAGHNGPLGIRLRSDQPPTPIADDLGRFDVVALEFPKFTDGRAYSYARLLRERYGFRGELRAVGNVLRDQYLFMQRCGFDAFEVRDARAIEGWRQAMSEFSVFYQPAGDDRAPAGDRRQGARGAGQRALVAKLSARYAGLDGGDLLRAVIEDEFPGRVALVSSFGAEAAVLLALAAEVDPALPVIFLETGKHFGETLRYRNELAARLGLEDVRSLRPEPFAVRRNDADGTLWRRDPDACCQLRKVLPLRRALEGFDAWITGRKRYQGGVRGELPVFEIDGGRIKVNPLAAWTREQVEAEFAARDLPPHPLEAEGYLSIGCQPCTRRVGSDEDRRAGRWAGVDKTECGIHFLDPVASG